jgi:hypothetical protein
MMNPFEGHGHAAFAVDVGNVFILFEAVFLQLLLVKDLLLLMVFGAIDSTEDVSVLHRTAAELADWLHIARKTALLPLVSVSTQI